MGRYPFAAIASGKRGQAIGIDLSQPAQFRTGTARGELLYIAYDLALTPEKKSADVRFATWTFDGEAGFRGAVARMYEIFPDQFRCRTPEQGVWMPFYAVSKVKGWEDFGFKFKEGNDETAWDNAHGLLTFRYTEPMTWWMTMPKDMPRTHGGGRRPRPSVWRPAGNAEAKALATSGFLDESGAVPGRLRNDAVVQRHRLEHELDAGHRGRVHGLQEQVEPGPARETLRPRPPRPASRANTSIPARGT